MLLLLLRILLLPHLREEQDSDEADVRKAIREVAKHHQQRQGKRGEDNDPDVRPPARRNQRPGEMQN